jgi:O-antigen ligase
MSRPILPESSRSWRYFPWLLGIGLSPLLYGSVPPWAQGVVGLLFGASLLLTADESASPRPLLPKSLMFVAVLFFAVIFIPLGPSILKLLSPGAAYLAENFPVEPGPPGSHPLTISTALSLARLWQICLVLSSFVLARRAFRNGFSPLSLLIMVCLAIAALGLAEFSRRWIGWSLFKLPGTGAGTFANRNHFASWIYTATLFALGGLLRALGPLRTARRGNIVDRGTVVALLVLVAVPVGCAAALVSASRGALAAFVLGCGVWAFFIGTRSRSRHRKAVLIVLGILALFPLIRTAGAVLDRLARTTETLGFKSHIWADSLRLVPQFPWFGTGPGSFVVAFNHFKTFRGESTFLFVENDWVQLMVETGLVGLGLSVGIGFLLASRLGRSLWREKFSEPELVFGAAAGFIAFVFHALGEFVTYVPANAILAATFVGLIAGARDQSGLSDPVAGGSGRMRATHRLAALIVLGLSLLQGAASWNAWKGLSVLILRNKSNISKEP